MPTPNDTPPTPTARRALEMAHLWALGLWAGALLMTGVAAAVLFPTMKSLDPFLPAYAAYAGDHWMLAAGRVANLLFRVSDYVGFAALAVIGLTTIALATRRWIRFARMPDALRLIALAAAVIIFIWTQAALRPAMDADLRAYWQAAEQGQQQRADAARADFARQHPTASFLMTAQFVALAWALAAGAWSAAGPPAATAPPAPASKP